MFPWSDKLIQWALSDFLMTAIESFISITLKGLCHAVFVKMYSSLYCFFMSSEFKHLNKILIERWNLTYISNKDYFSALFTTCFLQMDLNFEKRRAVVFQVNLFAIRVQFWPSALHCGFLVFVLCFSMVWNHYLVVSIYFKISMYPFYSHDVN